MPQLHGIDTERLRQLADGLTQMASTTPRKESEKIEGIVNSDSLLQIEWVVLNGLGALHPTNLNELGGLGRHSREQKQTLKKP